MGQMLAGLISAWPLVLRRSIAHWRMLSAVLVGVFLASAVMSGAVIYFESLRELALRNAIGQLTPIEADIVLRASRGPTSYAEYEKVARKVGGSVDSHLGWLLSDRIRGGRTSTFFLTQPGEETLAGTNNDRSYFAFLPRLEQNVTLLPGGRLPSDRAITSRGVPLVLEAIVHTDAADLFGVGIGDELSAIPYWMDSTPYARVVITGVFESNDKESEFWHLADELLRASTLDSFRTVGFHISEAAFMEVLGAAFVEMDSSYYWLLSVDRTRLNAGNTLQVRSLISAMNRQLKSSLFSYRQVTDLDKALRGHDQRLFFSKLPMLVILVLITGVVLYYVVTLSAVIVDQQRAELALLRSRGASSTQILSVLALEGATISILAIAVAPLLAAAVVGFLGYTPAFSDLSGNARLPVLITKGAYMMSGLGGLLSFAALMVPAFQASRIDVTTHRQQASRPQGQPFFQRFYLDVLLLVVAALLLRQLSEQGSVVATGLFGGVAVSHMLLAVPAVILVTSGMLLLRLFPLSIKFLSGDSPALVHLVVSGTVLILGASIIADGVLGETDRAWLAQLAILVLLGGAYYLTARSRRTVPRTLGMAAQAALAALILLVGPELPLRQVFAPILIGLVPAQAAFVFLTAWANRAPVGYSMGLWQMARNPTHYARFSLLMILMAGLGIFAASFGGTLQRSFEERALYASGADIRIADVLVNTLGKSRPFAGSYEDLEGVEKVSSVFRGFGSDLSNMMGETYTMFAVEAGVFGQIGWFREDFSSSSIDGLMGSLPSSTLPVGIELPYDARTIGVNVRANRPHPTVAVTARIRDSNDRYFTFYLGLLESDQWLTLEAALRDVRTGVVPWSHPDRNRWVPFRKSLDPAPPLTLVSLSVHEREFDRSLRAGSLILDDVFVSTFEGDLIVEPFDDVSAWNVLEATPAAISDAVQQSAVTMQGDGTGAATFAWGQGPPRTSRGIFKGPRPEPLPVLASGLFLQATGHAIGEEFDVSVIGHRIPIRLVEQVDYFPSVDTVNERVLIADLGSLSRYANLETMAGELSANEVWLSADSDGARREQLISTLTTNSPFPGRTLHDRAEYLAESQVDPLVEAGWSALLFMAFFSILVLSGVGFFVHAYVSYRSREAHFALMRTIGFSSKQLTTLVWLEQTLVIAAGLALGTWMGGRLGAIIMPYLSHSEQGTQLLPPFVMQVDWGTLAITYAGMVLVFALMTGGIVWFVRRISLQRILRLGEM